MDVTRLRARYGRGFQEIEGRLVFFPNLLRSRGYVIASYDDELGLLRALRSVEIFGCVGAGPLLVALLVYLFFGLDTDVIFSAATFYTIWLSLVLPLHVLLIWRITRRLEPIRDQRPWTERLRPVLFGMHNDLWKHGLFWALIGMGVMLLWSASLNGGSF